MFFAEYFCVRKPALAELQYDVLKLHFQFYSIRINDKWRIVFRWVNVNAQDAEICEFGASVNAIVNPLK